MASILFVCTANRFRSPLAAALLKKVLAEVYGPSHAWVVGSAGTWAQPGQPVVPVVLEVARYFGIDLAPHRAARVNGKLLAESDLILVMQSSQKEALQVEFPALADRIYLFSNVVERGAYDIPDRYSSEQEAMEVALDLNELIRRGRERICVLAGALHNERLRMQ
jgi:protein-tyrosine-phosphatase